MKDLTCDVTGMWGISTSRKWLVRRMVGLIYNVSSVFTTLQGFIEVTYYI